MTLRDRTPKLWQPLAALVLAAALAACAGPKPAEPVSEMPVMAPPVVAVATPPETAAPPPPPPAPPPERFAGHIASYRTMAEAEAAWPRLFQRHAPLGTLQRRFAEVDLGGQRGKVVRLLVGGFADRESAQAFCRTLRDAKFYCAPHDLPMPMPVQSASSR